MLSGEKGLFYWWDIYNTNLTITTKHKCRAETLTYIKNGKWEKHHRKPWNQHGKQNHKHTYTKRNWRQSNQKAKHKMAVLGSHLSISTLNVNGLNSPIKNIEWLNGFKKNTTIWCVYETYPSSKDKHRLELKGQNLIVQANDSYKEVGITHIHTR